MASWPIHLFPSPLNLSTHPAPPSLLPSFSWCRCTVLCLRSLFDRYAVTSPPPSTPSLARPLLLMLHRKYNIDVPATLRLADQYLW